MNRRTAALRSLSIAGAVLGYGCLAAFLWLVGAQVYRWLHDGEWTHIGVIDGLRITLTQCCVRDGDTGPLAALLKWLDSPVSWHGLHQVFEVLPASLALFALSIAGNSMFIYFRDRLERRAASPPP